MEFFSACARTERAWTSPWAGTESCRPSYMVDKRLREQICGRYLLGQERHWVEFFLPKLRYLYGFVPLSCSISWSSLHVCMGYEFGQILGLQRVQHVEEVLTRWALARGELVREVTGKFRILSHQWPDSFDRKFFIWRDRYVLYGRLLQQQFLTGHHALEEIFIDHGLIWKIVLEVLVKTTSRSVMNWSITY